MRTEPETVSRKRFIRGVSIFIPGELLGFWLMWCGHTTLGAVIALWVTVWLAFYG